MQGKDREKTFEWLERQKRTQKHGSVVREHLKSCKVKRGCRVLSATETAKSKTKCWVVRERKTYNAKSRTGSQSKLEDLQNHSKLIWKNLYPAAQKKIQCKNASEQKNGSLWMTFVSFVPALFGVHCVPATSIFLAAKKELQVVLWWQKTSPHLTKRKKTYSLSSRTKTHWQVKHFTTYLQICVTSVFVWPVAN